MKSLKRYIDTGTKKTNLSDCKSTCKCDKFTFCNKCGKADGQSLKVRKDPFH